MRDGAPRRRNKSTRGLLAGPVGVALMAWGAAVVELGCIDLFHSTDFGSCSVDAGDCSEAAAAAILDAKAHLDGHGGRDGTMGSGGDGGDATADGRSPSGEGGGDAAGDSVSPPNDAGRDAAGDAPAFTGTNFCDWNPATAQEHAVHACLWLAACAGNADLNEYGVCYPNALQAYDCNLNPNQEVRGALHSYWDALWQATTCSAVLEAVFAGPPPKCDNAFAACGNDLDGGSPFGAIATVCRDGGFASAVHCDMQGYVCAAGKCVVSGSSGSACASSPPPSCNGTVLHTCQTVENNPDAGAATALVDLGKDCAGFGAGRCVADAGAQAVGCVPNGPTLACTPSAAAACGTSGSVTGCATGQTEVLRCPGFGNNNACSVADGGWFASANDLVRGCYDPFQVQNGYGGLVECVPGGFQDYAGPSGAVDVTCPDAGLGECMTNPASPRCLAPGL